mmetsp:Transcript_5310/g.19417  ORF Transcript_5310/g.19417 Transcript_5310/m.19417 type:complete len:341 (-) Transcript_5310:160-1182(-)
MLYESCAIWLDDFKCDGLRFDSANDLPMDTVQMLTYNLRSNFPDRIMTAEVTPENPVAIHEFGFDSLWVHSGYFDVIQQHRALGRGHHGGGDWADGWNLPKMRTVMCLHYGFNSTTHCVKYMLGSHDQCGCKHGGAHYEDYKEIGGQHRYPVDQFGAGRGDGKACNAVRLWYTANVMAAGIPLLFMGSEFHASGWWNNDEWHSMKWDLAMDDIGISMRRCVARLHALRLQKDALMKGIAQTLHEDRKNGVFAVERIQRYDNDGFQRFVIVVNAGQGNFQEHKYGVWVGGGAFKLVFSSQWLEFGGCTEEPTSSETQPSYDGQLWVDLPHQCAMVFEQVEL